MPLDLVRRQILGLEVLEIPGDPGGASIILFHGFGADAYDLVALSQVYKGSPKPTWYFPNAPMEIQIAPGHTGRAWFEIDIERLKNLLHEGEKSQTHTAFPSDFSQIRRMGEQLIAELNIPLSKLFLGGFSQGAILAVDLGLNLFDKVAGLLLFSGTLVHAESTGKLAHQHAGLSFFQSHGINDPILPIEGARALEKVLLEGGMKGKLHTFQGGHEIPHKIIVEFHRYLTDKLSPH
jgi:phospholipase/carboxylesterase